MTAKRFFDITISALATVTILPLLFIIFAYPIKHSSQGPVFFRQRRSGIDGKIFYCIKFRTMLVNKDADTLSAKEGDERITRIGKFLRETSLDEVPQFLNVLTGDMSIIGPRPHMLFHTEYYSGLILEYKLRLKVRPGITGASQIMGLRGSVHDLEQMKRRVRVDNWYIRNRTHVLDMKIFIRTISIMIKQLSSSIASLNFKKQKLNDVSVKNKH